VRGVRRVSAERPDKIVVAADSPAGQLLQEGLRQDEEGNWAEAIKAYEQAIALNPLYVEAHIYLGDAYMSMGKYKEAFAAYNQAIRIAPTNADAHASLGAAFNEMAQYGAAFKPLVQAIHLDPKYAEAYYGIGYAYEKLENFKEAVGYLRSAIRLDPNYPEARLSLGLSYLGLGQFKAAEEQRNILERLDASLAEDLSRELRKAGGGVIPPPAQARPAERSHQVRTAQRPSTKAVESGSPQRVAAAAPPPPKSARAEAVASPLEVELKFWDSIKNSDDPEEFAAYLRKYPDGQFSDLARIRLRTRGGKKSEPGGEEKERAQEVVRKVSKPESELAKTAPADPSPRVAPPVAPPVDARRVKKANGSALEETLDWVMSNFSSKFTYEYFTLHESQTAAPSAYHVNVDFQPLQFTGCRIEWHDVKGNHAFSLVELNPLGVKVELRRMPDTAFSKDVWNLRLTAAGGADAFQDIEGDGNGTSKKYKILELQYEDKEKADKLATALKRAIELCGGKAEP
jgi:tetratricopeptide (TPR) repeat protein